MSKGQVSRRSFLELSGPALSTAAAPLAFSFPAGKKVPVGLELYSVRDELARDLTGTVRAVAKTGYEVVEFISPYYNWKPEYAKEVRKLLDDLGIRCNSTHNGANAFTSDGLPKAIELNQILGAKSIVMASPGRVTGLDGWKNVADRLTNAQKRLNPPGMRAGHNHKPEFVAVDGKRPIGVIAANTPKELMLQLDVGTCVDAGSDPVAWINANPGRINSIYCKDWAPGEGKGYRVLFGEGDSPSNNIFEAEEASGSVEYYLIEQEGSRFPSPETAERCIATWRRIRA